MASNLIPFVDDQEDNQDFGLQSPQHALILESLKRKALGLPEGFNLAYTYGVKKTPPTPEQFKALLGAAGVNPEKDAELRNAQIAELRDLSTILSQHPEPRSLELAPAYAFSKGIYGRDVTPQTPAEKGGFDVATQLAMSAKMNELIKAGSEEGMKLAALASKLGTVEPSGKYQLGHSRPGQGLQLRETDVYRDQKDLQKALPKSFSEIENTIKSLKEELGSFDPHDESALSAESRAKGISPNSLKGKLGNIAEIAGYKAGMSSRSLSLLDKLISYNLRDITGLTATEFEQEKMQRMAAFTALGTNADKRKFIVDLIQEMQSKIAAIRAGFRRPGVLEGYDKDPNAITPERLDPYLPGSVQPGYRIKGGTRPKEVSAGVVEPTKAPIAQKPLSVEKSRSYFK